MPGFLVLATAPYCLLKGMTFFYSGVAKLEHIQEDNSGKQVGEIMIHEEQSKEPEVGLEMRRTNGWMRKRQPKGCMRTIFTLGLWMPIAFS